MLIAFLMQPCKYALTIGLPALPYLFLYNASYSKTVPVPSAWVYADLRAA